MTWVVCRASALPWISTNVGSSTTWVTVSSGTTDGGYGASSCRTTQSERSDATLSCSHARSCDAQLAGVRMQKATGTATPSASASAASADKANIVTRWVWI